MKQPIPATLLTILFLGPLLQAARGPMEGKVVPVRQVEVSAPVSSRLAEVKVEEGDVVKAGQVLAQLYGRLEELEMKRAKALLDRREFEAKGAKRLYENKIIPETKAVEIQSDLDLARLQYEAAVEQVRLRTILAPMDGVIVRREHEVGESVSTGQPLFRIMDLSKVVVQCPVDASRVVPIAVGTVVKVRLDPVAGSLECKGTVLLVDPCADAMGLVRVKVLVDNPEGRFRAGARAWVELDKTP